MQFVIDGRTIDLNSLEQRLDHAFISLYSAYYGHGAFDLADFEAAALQFFDSNPIPCKRHEAYFNNFTFISESFQSIRNFVEAEQVWDIALGPALKWESSNQGKRIHKGAPYYFWGKAALLGNDLDKGYALMHRAVEEDEINSSQTISDSPAFALATLNYSKEDQNFRQWVLSQAQFLEDRLNKYSALYGRQFILDDFKKRFLSTHPSTETVFLLAYTVARLMRISGLPADALRSSFASQLESNILFDISLVIGAAIRAKNPSKWKFIDHALFLLGKAGHPLSRIQLREIDKARDNDFDSALKDAVDGKFTLKSGLRLTRLQSDVAVAYMLRNHGAHDVSSAPTIRGRFLDIEQIFMNVLFATVDYLY